MWIACSAEEYSRLSTPYLCVQYRSEDTSGEGDPAWPMPSYILCRLSALSRTSIQPSISSASYSTSLMLSLYANRVPNLWSDVLLRVDTVSVHHCQCLRQMLPSYGSGLQSVLPGLEQSVERRRITCDLKGKEEGWSQCSMYPGW